MSKTFTVQRSATIAAPADRLYSFVVDLHRWVDWSPWEGLDPSMEREYGDITEGVGATYGWKGNSKVGQGSMTISEVSRTRG